MLLEDERNAVAAAVVDLDGAPVDCRVNPSNELWMHLGVYRARDHRAVVHTHSRYATAVGTVVPELPAVHASAIGSPSVLPPEEVETVRRKTAEVRRRAKEVHERYLRSVRPENPGPP